MNPKIIKERKNRKEKRRPYLLKILTSVVSLTEFGNKFGLTRERARQLIKEYDLPYDKIKNRNKRKERYLNSIKERDKNILIAFQSGMTGKAISKKYKISDGVVYYVLKRNSIDALSSFKLNKQKRNESILCMFKQGIKRKSIAKKFGLSIAQIFLICRKLTGGKDK